LVANPATRSVGTPGFAPDPVTGVVGAAGSVLDPVASVVGAGPDFAADPAVCVVTEKTPFNNLNASIPGAPETTTLENPASAHTSFNDVPVN
jgi:hypothetical protein